VARQDQALTALERTVRGLRQAWYAISEIDNEPLRRQLRVGAATPRVRARIWENNARTEQAIVGALVALGTPRWRPWWWRPSAR
jgi:hypothetical protein